MNLNDIAKKIAADIAAMPDPQRTEAIVNLFGSIMAKMQTHEVRMLKAEVLINMAGNTDLPIVKSVLEVIDGNLALREIEGEDYGKHQPDAPKLTSHKPKHAHAVFCPCCSGMNDPKNYLCTDCGSILPQKDE